MTWASCYKKQQKSRRQKKLQVKIINNNNDEKYKYVEKFLFISSSVNHKKIF